MSLEERLDTDLGELGTDKRNPNGTTRCQSMMVYEDLDWGNWTKIIEISCTPGDSSCSQWVEQSAREVVIPHGSGGRPTRSRNLTEKGLAYKKELSERGEGRSIAD